MSPPLILSCGRFLLSLFSRGVQTSVNYAANGGLSLTNGGSSVVVIRRRIQSVEIAAGLLPRRRMAMDAVSMKRAGRRGSRRGEMGDRSVWFKGRIGETIGNLYSSSKQQRKCHVFWRNSGGFQEALAKVSAFFSAISSPKSAFRWQISVIAIAVCCPLHPHYHQWAREGELLLKQ